MPSKSNNQLPPSNSGIFATMGDEIRLVMRLLGDRRVNPLLKLIPLGTVLYFIIPLDLFIGPIDDAVVIGMGLYLFIELCPPEIVGEHRRAIRNTVYGTASDINDAVNQIPINDDQIVEGEFREE